MTNVRRPATNPGSNLSAPEVASTSLAQLPANKTLANVA